MSDTQAQVADMIAQLQQMRTAHPELFEGNPDLDDKLQSYADHLKSIRDGDIRREGQAVIGATHMSIREGYNLLTSRVEGFFEDARAREQHIETAVDQMGRLVLSLEQSLTKREAADAGHISAIQEGTAAVKQLWSEFRKVAENVSEMSNDVADLKQATITQDNFNHQIVDRVDRIEARQKRDGEVLQAHDKRIANLEAYAASMPPKERIALVSLIKTNAAANEQIQQEQLASRQRQEEIMAQLNDVLDRLPERN